MSKNQEPPTSVRLGPERLATIDWYAREWGWKRHAVILHLVDEGRTAVAKARLAATASRAAA
jgi:hypothetical protein